MPSENANHGCCYELLAGCCSSTGDNRDGDGYCGAYAQCMSWIKVISCDCILDGCQISGCSISSRSHDLFPLHVFCLSVPKKY